MRNFSRYAKTGNQIVIAMCLSIINACAHCLENYFKKSQSKKIMLYIKATLVILWLKNK